MKCFAPALLRQLVQSALEDFREAWVLFVFVQSQPSANCQGQCKRRCAWCGR